MPQIELAPTAFVSRLQRLDACAVSDAMDSLKLAGVITGIAQRSGSGRIAGRVVTMKLGVGDPPAGPPRLLAPIILL
jgi:4-hydroxy-4-methyl-2-oxoglutarate aldolase